VYSHSDLREVVRYAWERGIRVVPEWEMPGHAYGFVALPFSLWPRSAVLNTTV
jgi:hexosaminidase